jgi:hypothetical protein
MELDKIIDADKLPKNGVLVIKSDNIDAELIDSLKSMGEALKPAVSGKNISVFVLKTGDNIETLTPEQMERFGWFKKNKGDLVVSIERGALLSSLLKEIKGGSKGAITDLAEVLAGEIAAAVKKPEFEINLK